MQKPLFFILFFLLFTIACIGDATAEEGKLKVLYLASSQESEINRVLLDALDSQFSDLEVELQIEWLEDLSQDPRVAIEYAGKLRDERGLHLAVWGQNLESNTALLYIADMASDNTLLRVLYFNETDSESRCESIAYVVRGVVRAIKKGGGIGVVAGKREELPDEHSQEKPEETPPVVETTEEAAAASHLEEEDDDTDVHEQIPHHEPNESEASILEASVSYMLSAHSSNVPVVHAVRAALILNIANWARPFIAYRASFPFTASGDAGSVTVTSHPLEIGWSAVYRQKQWAVGGGVSFVANRMTWKADDLPEGIEPMGEEARWAYFLSPQVVAALSPATVYRVFVAVGVDVMLNKWDFTVETEDSLETVDSPSRVATYLQVGFELVLF